MMTICVENAVCFILSAYEFKFSLTILTSVKENKLQ